MTLTVVWAVAALAALLVGMRYKRPVDEMLGAALFGPIGVAVLYHRGQKAERKRLTTEASEPAVRQDRT